MSAIKSPSQFIYPAVLEEEARLRKLIKRHRDKRYASAYKKRMRALTKKARERKDEIL